MDKRELISQIAYQLSRLTLKNAQHEFELLALDLGRARVASNLIPATGPVGSGGDQGHDFDSFKTYLVGTLGSSNPFLAKVSNGIVVGAATLQQPATLPAKIKGDLATLFAGAEKPTHVVYFCSNPLVVAKQHELKDFCLETYGARLDIWDSEAISLHLSDSDTFWIAAKYLDIPADAYPITDFDDAYTKLRAAWINSGRQIETYADFIDVKQGLRTATFDERANADLNDWLTLTRSVIDNGFPPRMEQWARYEVCVAELRGRGSLTPALPYFQRFLDLVTPISLPSEIFDTAVLLVYAHSACRLGAADITPNAITVHIQRLNESIDTALAAETTQRDRGMLLEARATIGNVFDDDDLDFAEKVTRVVKLWSDVLDVAENVPLFPISQLSNLLELMSEIYGKDIRYRELTSRADALTAKQSGAGDIGDRARNRAIKHIDNGHIVAAIDEMQRVKAAWFSGESVIGSILAMMLLSDLYSRLHLSYAARYYAAGAFFVALNEHSDKVPKYIAQAAVYLAKTFYSAGEGMTFVRSAAQALTIHEELAPDAQDWDKHEHVKATVMEAQLFRSTVLKLAPELLPVYDEALKYWPLPPNEIESLKKHSEDSWMKDASREDVLRLISDQIGCSPFSDIGHSQSVTWAALGLTWTVVHKDSAEARLIALELATTLQIIQADLAEVDLDIVPSDVHIQVHEIKAELPTCSEIPENEVLAFDVGIPESYEKLDISHIAVHMAAVAISILRTASVLPKAEFDKIIDRHMDRVPARGV